MRQIINVRRTDGTLIKIVHRRLKHLNHKGKIVSLCSYQGDMYRVYPDTNDFQIVVPCVYRLDVQLQGLQFDGGSADDGD